MLNAAGAAPPVGLIDSGIGGLTIWRAVRRLLPNERLAYIADQAYFPYGNKDAGELCFRVEALSQELIAMGAKLIVLACNTASVSTLAHLRTRYPDVPFVGVVPVIRTLARHTRSGTIALLCTTSTARSPYTRRLAQQFAPDKELVIVDCRGLESLIEAGELRTAAVRDLLLEVLQPVIAMGADVAGLSCTHYPLVRPALKRILGPGVKVFEPSRPVARRVRFLLAEAGALAPAATGPDYFGTTGDAATFRRLAERIVSSPGAVFDHVDLTPVGK